MSDGEIVPKRFVDVDKAKAFNKYAEVIALRSGLKWQP